MFAPKIQKLDPEPVVNSSYQEKVPNTKLVDNLIAENERLLCDLKKSQNAHNSDIAMRKETEEKLEKLSKLPFHQLKESNRDFENKVEKLIKENERLLKENSNDKKKNDDEIKKLLKKIAILENAQEWVRSNNSASGCILRFVALQLINKTRYVDRFLKSKFICNRNLFHN